MWKVTWRNLLARKVRLALSGFAIVLGVAFVAGTLIFTDAMGGTFDDIIEGSTADVEIGFEGGTDFVSGEDNRTMPASVAADLEQLPGVESVHPSVGLQTVFVLDKEGQVIGGNGPPGLAFNPTDATSMHGKPILDVVEGKMPDGPGQVALDTATVEKGGFAVGDQISFVTGATPPQLDAELVGIVEFGAGGTNGATLSIFELGFMQDTFFEGEDVYNAISLNAADGVSQRELADQAQQVLPDGVVAWTGDEYVEMNKAALDELMGFLTTFLLVFAGVSLVVGIFLIINTFSILIAQRSRELALLRALGASRGQVNRSVILEALAVGVAGSTLGLGLGYLLALGLRALFASFGLDLGDAAFTVSPATIFWAYAVGLVVTAIAAVTPAVRASRIPPMAALRDDVSMPEATLRRRMVVGTTLVVVGALSMFLGLLGDGATGLWLIGLGILMVLVGVSLMSALLGRPLLLLFGIVYRKAFGAVGNLATQNTLRNPRRTGATASALMIGLALMSMMSIFGSSASASTDAAIKETLTSELVISNAIGQPFSPGIAEEVARVDGVKGVAPVRFGYPKIGNGYAGVLAVDPTVMENAFELEVVDGDVADLGPGKVAVSDRQAKDHGYHVGQVFDMEFDAGTQQVEVAVIFAAGGVPSDFIVSPDALEKGGQRAQDSMVFVTMEDGVDNDAVRADIEAITDEIPTVTVNDPQEFADAQKAQINQFLYMIYGLLGLSVVIAILGVVNTLSLSVIERTREVGLLRAVGLGRRQLRTMIRLESVVVTVFGAILGLVMGVIFGSSLVIALRDQGLTDLAIPWGLLVGFVIASALLGVLAAVFPARRAAKLDVLQAIATD
ncbi:FtsX-like permease family protein [Nocardioides sp. AE5]|uniref:ABC transporter permease n=1 Tax=Nocardioides sp. AE5 TaxID=2962573 RepID=UPI00288270AB|nr:FtsX-like permease family protein [Nocardioides sp. AE5]MDT0203717.1 FtsX-like permease family protein [Nocardioides sp. AE5]